jgi:hypothetical protein
VAAGWGVAVWPAPLKAGRIEGVRCVPQQGEGAMLVTSAATRADEEVGAVLGFVRRAGALATVS